MELTLSEQFRSSDFGVIPRVTLTLAPGAVVIAHAHALLAKDTEISMQYLVFNRREQRMPIAQRAMRGGRKWFSGNVMVDLFTNNAKQKRQITFHSPLHGGVVWIDASRYGNKIICERHHFVAALDPEAHFDIKPINASAWRKYVTGGTQEKFFQSIEVSHGADPHVFIGSRTMTAKVDLAPGEKKHLHHNALLAATDSVDISLYKIPGFINRQIDGEGAFFTEVTGPGTVWLNTQDVPGGSDHHGGLLNTALDVLVPG